LGHALRESATGHALFTIDPQARVTSWSAEAANLLGWSEAEALDLDSRLFFLPEDRERGAPEAEIAKAAAEGRAEDERLHLRKDGGRFWGSGLLVPLRGGPTPGFLKLLRDRTDQRRTEIALRQRHERLELLTDIAAQLISGDDPEAVIIRLFRAISAHLGIEVCFSFAVEVPGRLLRLDHHVGIPEATACQLTRLKFGQTVCGTVAQTRRAIYRPEVQSAEDAQTAVIRELGIRAYACYPLEAAGQLLGTLSFGSRRRDRFADEDLAFFHTISYHVAVVKGRKRAEAQQGLLLQELSHRVKNTLALILAMARRMGGGTFSVPEFLATFEGRVRALAAAHELLTASGWRPTPLRALARAALVPHHGFDDERIQVEIGEDLPLNPAATQDLVLVLHELVTNAAKHGALSMPGGNVVLQAQAAAGELVLIWREAGGPTVRPPAALGLGSLLLQQAVVHQLGGRAVLDWRPEGLVCTLRLPIAKIIE
jgi:PAS domain S-box-containing protein